MYEYITENNLENKQTYMYSSYRGYEFLEEYQESRIIKASGKKKRDISFGTEGSSDSIKRLNALLTRLKNAADISKEDIEELNFFNKTFEVRKRLYSQYGEDNRPISGANYNDLDVYFALANCLIIGYRKMSNLKYLNCLLKVDDTLLSLQYSMTSEEIRELTQIIDEEIKIFKELVMKKGL